MILADAFNIDLLKINEKHIIGEYFDMLTINSCYPKITVPTRLTYIHDTLIDDFLCKLTDNTLDTTSGVLIKKVFSPSTLLYFTKQYPHQRFYPE